MPAYIRKEGDAVKALLGVVGAFKNVHAEVGVLDGARPHEDSNLTMGELAVIQEFGAPSKGIPARSFLGLGVARAMRAGFKEFARKQIIAVQKRETTEALALRRIADFLEGHIKELFQTHGDGSWAPNAASTIKHKHHGVQLIDTRALLESISARIYNAQTRTLVIT